MKTSEFIKYFEDEGYRVCKGEAIISVEDENRNDIFDISKHNNVDTYHRAFDNLPFEKQQEYYKAIFEYLMTPIEAREEEKKYYLRHKGFSDRYLTYDFSTYSYFLNLGVENTYDNIKTKFAQSEINDLPECYTHPAVWEQIEVDEND